MPFVEILAPPAGAPAKAALARALTRGITDGFGIGPETVTIYFLPIATGEYAHAGEMGGGGTQRIFVKVHAFRRDAERRAAVAASVTHAVAAAFEADPEAVAVYFLERAPDEVAHGATLAAG